LVVWLISKFKETLLFAADELGNLL